LSSWPEFDKEILGGNYTGHYGHLKEGAMVSVLPEMQNNPLLKGVDPGGFLSPNWLYKNSPLRSDHVKVLMLGTISDKPSEPVFWLNENQYGKAIYTSLGHWDDWKIESFKKLMLNSVNYLLKQ
jgi:type 1 glutamine amidotransferase